jgi:hypothetical protein
MSEADFNTEIDKYEAAWDKFFEDIANDTLASTDEVGDPTRSKWLAAQSP